MKSIDITVITITYNNIDGLKATVESMNYDLPIEHIIVDGKSSDETLTFLQTLNQENVRWLSERDEGIYDAMNKGLSMAKGRFVVFMNAGDSFHRQETLSELVDCLSLSDIDVLYGETMLVDDSREHLGTRSSLTTRKLPQQLTWRSLKKGMLVCHQSFICSRAIAPSYIMNNLSADIDWEIRCLKNAERIVKFPDIISNYLVGGISKEQHTKSLIDRFSVMLDHYGLIQTVFSHIYFIARVFIHKAT